jgi:hypothetical protein
MLNELPLIVASAAVGALVSGLIQWLGHVRRKAQAARALRADIGMIYRHIDASLRSLDLPAGSPPYLVAARLRYAMFERSPLSPSQLEFITATGQRDRAKVVLTLMRNCDIFLEEVAARVDAMDAAALQAALAGARENMSSLAEFLDTLGLRQHAVVPSVPADLARKVRKRASDRELHGE